MAVKSDFQPVRHRVLKQELVGQLLDAIFAGRLAGGDRLVEQHLGAQFGVSRTPVREAFNELVGIGVIELQANRGAIVRPFGPQALRDIYQLRCILEMEATRLARRRLDHADLQKLMDEMQGLMNEPRHGLSWSGRVIAADERLHTLIASACDNERLKDEIRRYQGLVRAIRRTLGNRYRAQERAIQEHLAIIEALQRKQPAKAAQAMGHHIEQAAHVALMIMYPKSSMEQDHDADTADA